jgi:methionyl-tRNA formyltransferase
MKIVFMGTPSFAVPSLERVLKGGHEVVAVFTQPDRPKGRKRELTPPPVKEAALSHGIPVHQPERMRSEEAIRLVESLMPDLIVTAAYGQILPRAVLDVPRLGCINVHGSLLPKYRGGAPIQRSIMNGESVTGVTIMYMAEGLDTGDMISRVEVAIEDTDTSGTLFDKLSIAGADLLARTLPQIEAGSVAAVPQVHEEATYAPNLTREDERIDWTRSARQLFDQVRGLSPMAGAFTLWNGEPFKVWRCVVERAESAASGAHTPGTVLSADAEGIVVQAGIGMLRLLDIQPAGKRTMPAAEWLKGARLEPGQRFGGEGHE